MAIKVFLVDMPQVSLTLTILNWEISHSENRENQFIKLFSYSTQLSTKLLLINVKMPTIVGILTFIGMINTTSERLKQETSLFFCILVFMSS